jgi:hypothetical protein
MKTKNSIHIAINYQSEGIEDQYGVLHRLDIKEAWRLATDYQFQWGEEFTVVDDVLQHNFKNRDITKSEWYKAYHDYRKFHWECAQGSDMMEYAL